MLRKKKLIQIVKKTNHFINDFKQRERRLILSSGKKLSALLHGVTSERDNVLEFNQYLKSDKKPYIIYTDIELSIKKIDGCRNNPKNSSITKIGQHICCGYSISITWAFDHIEDKHTLYHKKGYEKVLWIFQRTPKKYS